MKQLLLCFFNIHIILFFSSICSFNFSLYDFYNSKRTTLESRNKQNAESRKKEGAESEPERKSSKRAKSTSYCKNFLYFSSKNPFNRLLRYFVYCSPLLQWGSRRYPQPQSAH